MLLKRGVDIVSSPGMTMGGRQKDLVVNLYPPLIKAGFTSSKEGISTTSHCFRGTEGVGLPVDGRTASFFVFTEGGTEGVGFTVDGRTASFFGFAEGGTDGIDRDDGGRVFSVVFGPEVEDALTVGGCRGELRRVDAVAEDAFAISTWGLLIFAGIFVAFFKGTEFSLSLKEISGIRTFSFTAVVLEGGFVSIARPIDAAVESCSLFL